jgi:hypothetical protein
MKILLLSISTLALYLTSLANSKIQDLPISLGEIPENVMYYDPETGLITCGIPTKKTGTTSLDLTDGLMAWYPFNGNADDVSKNGNHGTMHGTIPAKDRNGQEGGALYFDGNSHIVVPHSDSLNPKDQLTVSTWIKIVETTNDWSPIIHKGGTYQNGFKNREYSLWQHRNPCLHFTSAGKESNQKTYNTTVKKGDWLHFLVSLDRKNHLISTYLDGELISTWSDTYSDFNNNKNDIKFGSSAESNSNYSNFTGYLDSTRLYSKALNADEVTLLYKRESNAPSDGRPTPPPTPGTGELTPPDPDYKDTIAELKKLLVEKDKKLAYCEKEIETLNNNVSGLEKQVASLTTDNEVLKGQVKNLREENHNISYELTVTTEHLEKAIHAAETPFINGWVYDPGLGWLFTDADHFPLVYTHKDETWHYYELGSSNPRYFFNYKTQEWVAWDAIPAESVQVLASSQNL